MKELKDARRYRPAALVFVVLAAVSMVPHLRATLAPPPGARYVGVFYSIPDLYNYFSYMQQAEVGAFLFRNKLSADPHPPALVNLEWWAVGLVSRLTGMDLPNAFRGLGIVATFFLVFGVDRWLTRAGLPSAYRLGALLLVFLGGGFGGVLFLALGPPAWRFLDLTTGLFPVISILVNPHFVTGTALLVWAVLCLNQGGSAVLGAVLLGNVLALSRPYDVALLVGIHVLSLLLTEPRARWLPRALPLVGLLPGLLVNYAVLYGSPAFRMLSGFQYVIPNISGLALALGPAMVAAFLARPWAALGDAPTCLHRAGLFSWAIVALLAASLLSIPLPFLAQCAVNLGVPLFALASLGFTRWPTRTLLLAAALFSTTGLIALKLLLEDNPSWFVPRERIEVAKGLRPFCRPGETVMAPAEIGMYVNAYSSCRAFITHVVAPDSAVRQEEMTAFYLDSKVEARRALLDRRCVSHVVLPETGLEEPTLFLGNASGFRRSVQTGRGPLALAVHSRSLPASCAAARPSP